MSLLLGWATALLLLAGFTVLHLVTLAGHYPMFKTRDAVFFADASDYIVLTRQPELAWSPVPFKTEEGYAPVEDMQRIGLLLDREILLKKARKHPLALAMNHLVYLVWKRVLRPLRPHWSIVDEQQALLFPAALFGGLAVAGLYLFFRRMGGHNLTALLFAFLFGGSLSRWIYASLPESWSLQILLAVWLVMLIFRLPPGLITAPLLGLALAITALAGLNNVLLFVPVYLLFIFKGRPLRGLICCGIAALTVAGTYIMLGLRVSPRLGLAESIRLAGEQVATHSAGDLSLLLTRLIPVAGNHLFFSIGAIHVPQASFTGIGSIFHYLESPLPALFLVLYLVFLLLLALRFFTRGLPAPRHGLLVLAAWLVVHFLFYAVFNSAQPFLYSSLFLVPLMTIYFLVWSNDGEREGRRWWERFRLGVLGLLVLATFIDNWFYLSRFLR